MKHFFQKPNIAYSLCFILFFVISCGNLGKPSKEELVQNVNQENQMIYVWSLNAILNKENTANNFIYGGEKENHTYQNDYQKALKEWWDISNRFDCKTTVEQLIAGKMHNEQFQMEFENFFTMSETEFEQTIKNETKYKALYQQLKDNKETLQKNGIIAWDLVRASSIIAWGYNARYFNKRQAYQYSLEVGKAIQENFNSYSEMSENYLLGYFYWSNDVNQFNKRMKTRQELLDNSSSVWNLFPFKYDMSPKDK